MSHWHSAGRPSRQRGRGDLSFTRAYHTRRTTWLTGDAVSSEFKRERESQERSLKETERDRDRDRDRDLNLSTTPGLSDSQLQSSGGVVSRTRFTSCFWFARSLASSGGGMASSTVHKREGEEGKLSVDGPSEREQAQGGGARQDANIHLANIQRESNGTRGAETQGDAEVAEGAAREPVPRSSPTRTRTECEAHGLKFDQVCLDLEVVAERPKLSHQLHTTWGGGHSAAYITSLPRTQTDRTQTTAGKCWRCVRLRESRAPPGVIQRRACQVQAPPRKSIVWSDSWSRLRIRLILENDCVAVSPLADLVRFPSQMTGGGGGVVLEGGPPFAR